MSPVSELHGDAATWLQRAIELHQGGQLGPAQALYQQVLQLEPSQPDALHLLGLIEHQLGHSELGVQLIEQALLIRPDDATYRFNLGNIWLELKQYQHAAACYQNVIDIQPQAIQAHDGLAAALRATGQTTKAQRCEQHSARLRRETAGQLMQQGGQLFEQGQPAEAAECFRQATMFRPDFAEAHFNLATVLQVMDRLDEAAQTYQRALSIKPAYPEALCNLGRVQKLQGQLDMAAASYRQALALDARLVQAHNNLGNILLLKGDIAEAALCFRQALKLQSDYAEAHSNLLFALQYLNTCSPVELFHEHQRYAANFEAKIPRYRNASTGTAKLSRRLKIGYVSGDFFSHAVAHFAEPILRHHDKAQFEIFSYYNNYTQDAWTDRIICAVDHWFVCHSLSDDQLAERIRADGIDILVDLSGHTAFNRLLVFARKPAPVQVTWIGYPGSTGLTAIDYRISDPWQDPPGLTERYHSETLVRLPSGMAFEPDPASPPVNPLPALQGERLMLACLNSLSKVNPAVIALWSRILHALPHARLMLGNAGEDDVRARLLGLFAQHQ